MIVTVETEASPPRVRLDVAVEDVWRVEGATRTRVRGNPDAGVIYDYEAPQGVPVIYDDGLTLSAPVVMPDVGVWLIPPGSPELGVALLPDLDAYPGWSRPSDERVTEVPGRANAVAVSFTRKARRGQMKVLVLTADDFAALATCLDVGGPMLLSTPPSEWKSLARWVSIGDVNEEPFGLGDVEEQTWEVTWTMTPVDRPDLLRDTRVTVGDLVGTVGALAGTVGELGNT